MAIATADLTAVSKNMLGEPRVPFTFEAQDSDKVLADSLRPQIEHLWAKPDEKHGNLLVVYELYIKIVRTSPTTGWAELSRCRNEIDTTVYPEQPEKEELYGLYSDLYKDVVNHRPQNWPVWRDLPIEALQDEIKRLSARLKAESAD